MSAKTNGGPAFPQNDSEECMHGPGMTIRDYFAGQALAALAGRLGYRPASAADEVARDAYLLADAMIEERAK